MVVVVDADANLSELRTLVNELLTSELVDPETACRAAELFDGLDRWLSSGGFLPRSWRRAKPV